MSLTEEPTARKRKSPLPTFGVSATPLSSSLSTVMMDDNVDGLYLRRSAIERLKKIVALAEEGLERYTALADKCLARIKDNEVSECHLNAATSEHNDSERLIGDLRTAHAAAAAMAGYNHPSLFSAVEAITSAYKDLADKSFAEKLDAAESQSADALGSAKAAATESAYASALFRKLTRSHQFLSTAACKNREVENTASPDFSSIHVASAIPVATVANISKNTSVVVTQTPQNAAQSITAFSPGGDARWSHPASSNFVTSLSLSNDNTQTIPFVSPRDDAELSRHSPSTSKYPCRNSCARAVHPPKRKGYAPKRRNLFGQAPAAAIAGSAKKRVSENDDASTRGYTDIEVAMAGVESPGMTGMERIAGGINTSEKKYAPAAKRNGENVYSLELADMGKVDSLKRCRMEKEEKKETVSQAEHVRWVEEVEQKVLGGLEERHRLNNGGEAATERCIEVSCLTEEAELDNCSLVPDTASSSGADKSIQVVNGTKRFKDGDTWGIYNGQLDKSMKRHGQGEMIWDNGSFYSGQFKLDRMDGYGLFKSPEGDGCVGWFKDDSLHGYAEYTWNNGNMYCGNFAKGKRNGRGRLLYADGDLFEGTQLNDNWNGPGMLKKTNKGVVKRIDINIYKRKAKGYGVRWDTNFKKGTRLKDGIPIQKPILFEEAKALTNDIMPGFFK